ncbi:MAG TPA: hypothetical protein PKN80_02795 [bacterium]|nr:hypothetical protein [bacterium]HNS48767.1 hypothetical protein [bacterium]
MNNQKKYLLMGVMLVCSIIIFAAGLRFLGPRTPRVVDTKTGSPGVAGTDLDTAGPAGTDDFWAEAELLLNEAPLFIQPVGDAYVPPRRSPIFKKGPGVSIHSILAGVQSPEAGSPDGAAGLPRAIAVLNGIMVVDGRSTAIVNGEIVRAGDRVAGAEVVEIKADQVKLRKGQEEHFLVLE